MLQIRLRNPKPKCEQFYDLSPFGVACLFYVYLENSATCSKSVLFRFLCISLKLSQTLQMHLVHLESKVLYLNHEREFEKAFENIFEVFN